MMLTLKRRYFGHGTFGELWHNDNLICRTVERPWMDNQRMISCIPEGRYTIKPVESPKFGSVYCLENSNLGVTHQGPSQRTHILIHKANTADQLHGCIAPGMTFGALGEQWAVLNSSTAFMKLKELLIDDEHEITITRG